MSNTQKTPHEIAVERIRAAKASGQDWLDLGDLGLETLPDELKILAEQLKILVLGWNRYNAITKYFGYDTKRPHSQLKSAEIVARLTQLQTLDLSECTDLTEVPSLANLTHLQSLDLTGCTHLTEVPSLDSLTRLQTLNINQCFGLTQMPSLDRLTELQTLNIMYCAGLTEVPSLDNLTKLKSLCISTCTGLTELPSLDRLTELQSLGLIDCPIVDFEQLEKLTVLHEAGKLPHLQELFIDYTPAAAIIHPGVLLSGSPKEIFAAWRGQAVYEARVCFVGMGNVGKSWLYERCFLNRVKKLGVDPRERTQNFALIPPDRILWKPNNLIETVSREIQPRVWDFGGQLVLHGIHEIFLTDDGRTVYVLVLDQNRTPNRDRREYEEYGNALIYWLKMLKHFAGPTVPIVIAITQCDIKPDPRPVDEKLLAEPKCSIVDADAINKLSCAHVVQINEIVDQLCATSNDPKSIEPLQTAITFAIGSFREKIEQQRVSGDYIKVRNKLEEVFRTEMIISKEDYYTHCQNVGVDERDETKLRMLHNDGFAFYFGQTKLEIKQQRNSSFDAGGPVGRQHFQKKEVPALLSQYIVSPRWLKNAAYQFNELVKPGELTLTEDDLHECCGMGDGPAADYLRDFLSYAGLSFRQDDGTYLFPRRKPHRSLQPDTKDWLRGELTWDFLPEAAFHRYTVDMLKSNKVAIGSANDFQYTCSQVLIQDEGKTVSVEFDADYDRLVVSLDPKGGTDWMNRAFDRVRDHFVNSILNREPTVVKRPGQPESGERETLLAQVQAVKVWLDVNAEINTRAKTDALRKFFQNCKDCTTESKAKEGRGVRYTCADGLVFGKLNAGVIWKAKKKGDGVENNSLKFAVSSIPAQYIIPSTNT